MLIGGNAVWRRDRCRMVTVQIYVRRSKLGIVTITAVYVDVVVIR